MQTHEFFLTLLIILMTARVFAELANRLHFPSVIGELIAGIILGPSLLNWVEPVEAIKFMAEIGIILLLFEVGLGTDVKRLAETGLQSMMVALVGFVAPFLIGFTVGYWAFGLPLLVSLFIGGTLTATSIGITMRVLIELKRENTQEGRIILGAAVLDDVLGVILLALLYEFSIGGGINLNNATKVIIVVGTFFFLAPIAAKLISIVIKHFEEVSEIPGLIPTTIVSLVLFFAWLAHIMGAPMLLGGFAAGLALSRRFVLPFGVALHGWGPTFAENIGTKMTPITQLFTPIFFVTVGLSLNLHEVDWGSTFIWLFSLCIFVVAVGGKLLGGLIINRPWPLRWIIGVSIVPRGEVGLIFAELGRESGILTNEIHAGMIMVIALTTILPPFVIKSLYNRFSPSLLHK
ncbi:MAG: cation:proton antiporter [Nitrospinaceae bacterium]|nr:cation:proton antiporter [Nitrospinaceae bacterium]MBT5869524.1 cation:proton antiporter [Nitrospinaceae bacterium]